MNHSTKCNPTEKCTCDGYHTFDELYEHRHRLFIQLCKNFVSINFIPNVWSSTKHSDGSSIRDWFILGIFKDEGKQITYHLPARYWSEVCEFAEILERAPKFDGHTPDDVLARIANL